MTRSPFDDLPTLEELERTRRKPLVIAHSPPVRVWHSAWEGGGHGNVGTLLAEFTAAHGELYGWVIPPGSDRPLTFRMSAITRVDA
jgi:hypothetical protein